MDFKLAALKYRHMGSFIAVVRDRDTGRIYVDPVSGKPRIEYTPSKFDMNHALEGVIALSRICYVTGADDIRPGIPGIRPFVRSDLEDNKAVQDRAFEDWLAEVRSNGTSTSSPWPIAHLMGSNRMSVTPEEGVVDPKGKVWGVEGLYVADASVLPTATGVNPMVSNMSLSDWISRGIVEDLKQH